MTLPVLIDDSTPQPTDSPAFGDDHLRNIKEFIVEVFGVTNNTNYTTAAFTITSTGSVAVNHGGMTAVDLQLSTGEITSASSRPLQVSTTWNNSTVSFDAIRLTIIDTASTASSMFMNLRVGSTTMFAVRKDGVVTTGSWQATAVTEVYGGTNQTTYSTGQMIYASGTDTLAKLSPASTAGRYLRNGGNNIAPLWSTLILPNTSGTNNLLVSSAANTFTTLSGPSTASVLTASTTSVQDIAWTAFSLTDPSVTSITASSFGAFGATPATAGAVRIPNAGNLTARNGTNSANISMMTVDSSSRVVISPGGVDIKWGVSVVATGGGGTATLGGVGGSGPSSTGQAGWIRFVNSGDQTAFLPYWA